MSISFVLLLALVADEPSSAPVEVTVHGDKGDALKQASGSGTTIGEQDLKRAQPENAAEVLKRVPGVQVRQEDPSGFRLNIGVRGLSPTRSRLVLIQEDGIPVVVSPYGEPELYYMTMVERIQRIDVLKGSNVLTQGPQTVGAVIQLHTWEPTENASWFLAATGGSLRFGEAQARYSNTVNNVGFVVQGVYKQGAGYRNMPFQAVDVFGKARYAPSSADEVTLKIGFHDELASTTYTGLTASMYLANPSAPTVAPNDYFGIRRYEMGVAHEHRFSENTKLDSAFFAYQMQLNLRLQDFDRSRSPDPGVTYASIPDPLALYFRNTSSLRLRTYEVTGLQTQLEQRIETGIVRQKVTAGVRAMGDFAQHRLETGATPTADGGVLDTDDYASILGLAGWIEDQILIGDWVVVTPAFRLEHSDSWDTTLVTQDPQTLLTANVHNVGTSHSTGYMPGMAVMVGTPRLNGFTSGYLGYSAPRVSQAITPNGQDAHLSAEHSINFEIGARGRWRNWLRAEAAGFLIHFDNELVSNNPLSGQNSEFINGGQTQHMGFESTVTLRAGEALGLPLDVDVQAQYTFVNARFVGGSFNGNVVPYAPMNTTTATLDLSHKIGIGGQAAVSYIGAQFSDEVNSIQGGSTGLDGLIPGYATLDFNLRYKNSYTGLSLTAALKNALNQIYISDRLPNGIFTAGFRQLFVTLAWSPPG